MKIVYIADNRDRKNLGCRATSAALSAIIGSQHEIVGRISGRLTNSREFGFLPGILGILMGKLIYKRRNLSWLAKKIINRLPRSVYKPLDYLSLNFDKTIKKIIRYSTVSQEFSELNLDQYDYDAIVINAEGTMIFSTPARRDTIMYLMFSYWAMKRGKKVYFVNGMFSDCPRSQRNQEVLQIAKNVLNSCNIVTVRDPISFQLLIVKEI